MKEKVLLQLKVQYLFDDVDRRAAYANAVNWAKTNGIVLGHENNTFAPFDNLNKEQLAVILYRYAAYKKFDVSAKADLSVFEDADTVLEYSVEAMEYAVAMGIVIPESETVLNSKGTVTGGEVSEAIAILG